MFAPARSRLARPLLGLVTAGAALALGAAPSLASEGGHKGHHGHKKRAAPHAGYTQTQDPAGNQVVVYKRASNGTLTEQGRVSTGGVGSASNPPFGFPILDSQGGVELTKDGRLLFVVNAGDSTISSFKVKSKGGLTLVDRKPSGGDRPVSLDTHKHLLYVLNETSGNVTGFRFTSAGHFTAIPGSTESLSTPGGDGVAAEVGFSTDGRFLAVSQRATSVIDTFKLGSDGTPGPAKPNAANGTTPFGFAFRSDGTLIGSNAGRIGDPADPSTFPGTASSYSLNGQGTLTGLDNIATGQRATCWVVITENGRFTFMTNTLSNSISRIKIASNGKLTLLGNTATGSGFPSDEALSLGSRYLYVVVPSIMGGASHIDEYRVDGSGGLTHIGATPDDLPTGVSGAAAR
jgi:6-phosphogluconolactonase